MNNYKIKYLESKSILKEMIYNLNGCIIGEDSECPDIYFIIIYNKRVYGFIGYCKNVEPIVKEISNNKLCVVIGRKLYIIGEGKLYLDYDNFYLINEINLIDRLNLIILSELDVKIIQISTGTVLSSIDLPFVEDYKVTDNFIVIKTDLGRKIIRWKKDKLIEE
jgi:hypothetical protein